MNNNDLTSNIKKVLVVFLLLFITLISYIGYFQLFKAHDIAARKENKRLWVKRNEVVRGVIYDRNKTVLAQTIEKTELNQKRQYPGGEAFAHVVGYVDETYDLAGLEATYDQELISYDIINASIDAFLKKLNFKEEFNKRTVQEDKKGNNLITTLDANLQNIAFDALGTNKGAVVALNPKTGEILASVSKPSYDTNNLKNIWKSINTDEEGKPLINRATSGLYPPGSTFKIVTAASALENIPGVTTKKFKDNGKIKFNEKQSLSNYGGYSYGDIDLKKAISVSSNVVFGTLAMDLGNDKLMATAEKFGFNKKISSDDVFIAQSKFPKLEKSEIGNIAQTGIGQSSILASPMEMALVISTIANDGVMMKPSLMKEIVSSNGRKVKSMKPEALQTVISKDQASTLRDYLKASVDEKIKSQWKYVFNGTNTAGKTGTADYKLPNGENAVPHSWFVGFAPADNPQVAIAVIVENGGLGGGAAAQTAGKVIKAALNTK